MKEELLLEEVSQGTTCVSDSAGRRSWLAANNSWSAAEVPKGGSPNRQWADAAGIGSLSELGARDEKTRQWILSQEMEKPLKLEPAAAVYAPMEGKTSWSPISNPERGTLGSTTSRSSDGGSKIG